MVKNQCIPNRWFSLIFGSRELQIKNCVLSFAMTSFRCVALVRDEGVVLVRGSACSPVVDLVRDASRVPTEKCTNTMIYFVGVLQRGMYAYNALRFGISLNDVKEVLSIVKMIPQLLPFNVCSWLPLQCRDMGFVPMTQIALPAVSASVVDSRHFVRSATSIITWLDADFPTFSHWQTTLLHRRLLTPRHRYIYGSLGMRFTSEYLKVS